ncbi:N-acetylglucosaminyl-phosphatidylinositol de-N-acetylase-like isoform X2 [Haliotis asinina]|uniref:N-acetylglucosaminyl-phosphatidylinositol de-N-acetylase-like isoform X2 n=1 Tax=Haliotis asinina TaxID=109174 RepID=UPI003531D8DA
MATSLLNMSISLDVFDHFLTVCHILLTTYIFMYIFAVIVYIPVLWRKRSCVSKPKDNATVLFVTAHPDDECMFFAPAILGIGAISSVLCFTTGNYDQKGDLRKKEILTSCSVLGVSPAHVTVLDIRSLPDNPKVKWDRQTVCNEILRYCQKHRVTQIYTFDGYGVSGHSNHRELYNAVRHLKIDRKELNDIECYSLQSVNLLRKYTSLIDLPYSLYTADTIFVSSPYQVLTAQRAMHAHWSQFVWFRILFIFFSRYLIINTFTKINFYTHCNKNM